MIASNRHQELRLEIAKTKRFANAIFYDMKYDIDQLAGERTMQRLNVIDDQYGFGAVFGILANWALNSIDILQQTTPGARQSDFNVVPFISEDLNLAEVDPDERAQISAAQFVTAIAQDDLEMAEAIFLAARNSSKEDATALVQVILIAYINMHSKFIGD